MLTPTLHVEILLNCKVSANVTLLQKQICDEVAESFRGNYVTVQVGTRVKHYEYIKTAKYIEAVDVVDYTGPKVEVGWYNLENVELDVGAFCWTPSTTPSKFLSA